MPPYRLALTAAVVITTCSWPLAAVETIVEGFSGQGEYTSVSGRLAGFENSGWSVSGDGGFGPDGFVIQNVTEAGTSGRDELSRTITKGQCNAFRSSIAVRNLELGNFNRDNEPFLQDGSFLFFQRINNETKAVAAMGLHEYVGPADEDDDSAWLLTIWRGGPDDLDFHIVPRGNHIELSLSLNTDSQISYVYDPDVNDADEGLLFGPFDYRGSISEQLDTSIIFGAVDEGISSGILDQYSMAPLTWASGDFNGNGILDAPDIDLLSEAVRSGANESPFDLTADAMVNEDDRRHWVLDLKNTYFGDANLDGEFASSDLVNVFIAGEYEDDVRLNSTWATGDWNGDGDFTTSDMVLAFQEGGYELGPRGGLAVVPEPGSVLLLLLGGVLMFQCYRRK